MDPVELALKELGLEEKEIKIYLYLLSESSATVLMISKYTRIDRTTVYDVLNKLLSKGIVSFHLEKNVKKFSSLNPETLLKKFKQKYLSLQQVLPKLKSLSNQKRKDFSCELFLGREGILSVLTELINMKHNYDVIGIREEYEKLLNYFNDKGLLLLKERNIIERGIVDSKSSFKKSKNGQYKYLKKNLNAAVTTIICKTKTIFITWSNPLHAILIDDRNFAQAQKEYFSMLWSVAKSKPN